MTNEQKEMLDGAIDEFGGGSPIEAVNRTIRYVRDAVPQPRCGVLVRKYNAILKCLEVQS